MVRHYFQNIAAGAVNAVGDSKKIILVWGRAEVVSVQHDSAGHRITPLITNGILSTAIRIGKITTSKRLLINIMDFSKKMGL